MRNLVAALTGTGDLNQEDLEELRDFIEEAMRLDQPEAVCKTAQDIVARGMPENPIDTASPMALVYMNFPFMRAGKNFAIQRDYIWSRSMRRWLQILVRLLQMA